MTATSTKQYEHGRCVTDDTLQSLNLKIDNNFYEYVILIVGIDDHHYLFENLPKIISKDRIQLFKDVETSLTYIHSLCNVNIFLIISGTLGKNYAQQFIQERQILGIYIYCMDESKHALWTKGLEKIRCIVSDTTQLIVRLHRDIKELSGRWPLGEKSFQKASTSTSQWYHLFLLVICYRSQNIENTYHEMFNDCRAYYRNNHTMIEQINQLERTYEASDAIREFTRDGFLYRIVNHALRTQNMEIIRKYSPFIRDLHCQLHHYHQEYYRFNEPSIRVVYRGQSLSLDELNYLSSICKSRRPVITLTTFASASLDPDVALNFAFPVNDRIPCLFEIIITDEYNFEHKHMLDHPQAFANISSFSVMQNEQEVLFSLVTHFRVKHVEYPVNLSYRSWASVTLELITDKKGECSISHFDIIGRIEKETDSQIYNDILHMLQVNAEDELNFKNMNWQKWWSQLSKKWGTDEARDVPLLLTMYNCFTENIDWSRKAIEMYKNILRTHPDIQSNLSSFSHLFKHYRHYQKIPTEWIALYEEYLQKFCTINTEEVIQCLFFAGQTYEMITDKEHALECYQKALDMNVNNESKMNKQIQKRTKILKKPYGMISTTNNECTAMVKDIDENSSGMYEAQEEQWERYWYIKSNRTDNLSIEKRLRQLLVYLTKRQQWYDAADSKILLGISCGDTQELSVNDYRSYFLSVVKKHLSSSESTTDAAHNRSLSLWRYEKYMREWTLFQALENFLKPFQQKSTWIRQKILLQLYQLVKKLSVLITLCTVYICWETCDDKIHMTNIQPIGTMDIKMRQLVFFNLYDKDLLTDLEALKEESSTIVASTITTPDKWDDIKVLPVDVSDVIQEFYTCS